jgi:hypothetical protein
VFALRRPSSSRCAHATVERAAANSREVRFYTPAELFWIVKHGIRFVGKLVGDVLEVFARFAYLASPQKSGGP